MGYKNLPAISGIRAMYSVARNTSTDNNKQNYWVAEVIVIEADNYSAQPDDYLFIIGRADMVGNDTLANRQAVGSQYLLAISAKQGSVVRITANNLNWGVGTVAPGFYKAYGVTEVENGTLTIDRLSDQITPSNVNDASQPNDVNTSSFKLRAGIVNRTAGINDRFGVDVMTAAGVSREQITLKGPAYAIIVDGRNKVTVSDRLNGDNFTNQVILGRKILWVENGSNEALFTIDVTYSVDKSVKGSWMSTLLSNTWTQVTNSKVNNNDQFTVTVEGVYSTPEKTDGVVYLEKANGGYWNATGKTFTVEKGTDLLFKPVAGYGYILNTDAGVETVKVGADKLDDLDKLAGWYEIENITSNVTIKVALRVNATDTRELIVQDADGKALAATANNMLNKGGSITITGVPAGKTPSNVSIMVGFKTVAADKYELIHDANGCKIVFTENVIDEGDVVVVVTLIDIEEVELRIPVPAVNKKKAAPAANVRLVDDKVPMGFVNGDDDMDHYVRQGDQFLYTNLASAAAGKDAVFYIVPNDDAAEVYPFVLVIGDEECTVDMTKGTAKVEYTVPETAPVEIAEIKAVTNTVTFSVEGKTVENNGSISVYKVAGDTQSLTVSVTGVNAGDVEIYAVSNDTVGSNVIYGTSGQLRVSNKADVTIKVKVTLNGEITTYTYTVKFVSDTVEEPGNPEGPTTPDNTDPTNPDEGEGGETPETEV